MSPDTPNDHPRDRSESVLTKKDAIQISPARSIEDFKTLANQSNGSTTPKTLPSAADRARSLADVVLRFIGNASNETLGACAVGLATSTYLILGRLGLVLIGAFGGALVSITWDPTGVHGKADGNAENASRKRELGVELAKRALDWRGQGEQKISITGAPLKVELAAVQKELDFSAFPNEIASELKDFCDAVIKDYVKWWYTPILPDDNTFPGDCRQILVAFIHSFSNHVSRKRAADPFLDFLANSTSVVIVFLQELASALKASQRSEVEDALRIYLEFQPESNLAHVLNREQQKQKLHIVAEDILQSFLDTKAYNCLPVRAFLREVLAGLILDGTLSSCSKPEWINGWIVYLLEDGEPSLLEVIDQGVTELEAVVGETDMPVEAAERKEHRRRVSRAEQAMEDAMKEAQRINQMIAEEEASKKHGMIDYEDNISTTTTNDEGIATPASSDSELNHHTERERATSNPMMFDSEGNTIPITTSPRKKTIREPAFTSFDQLDLQPPPMATPTSEAPPRTEAMIAIPLTLHKASINILDMGVTSDQILMKQKPDAEMLIQIEPASSRFPGWMVTRSYSAFEPLSETLYRIARISGVSEFNTLYPELPSWKGQNRAKLIAQLEKYLRTALQSVRLAESDAMKKFLDKETGLDKMSASQKNVFVQAGAGLENVGKGFVNVIGQGGKGLQSGFQAGGKAVLGGVTGVFGAVANGIPAGKRPALGTSSPGMSSRSRSQQSIPKPSGSGQDLSRPSSDLDFSMQSSPRASTSARSSTDQLSSLRTSNVSARTSEEETLNLPPPPDLMTEEYESSIQSSPYRPLSKHPSSSPPSTPSPTKVADLPSPTSTTQTTAQSVPMSTSETQSRSQHVPVSEEETRMTVELVFALITELLSLSSAWTFRLSLLTAAKSYLLRPKNPQLLSIQALLQESVIDANFSESGIASHIGKLRANALPTEAELKQWPAEMTQAQKENLRIKARKLLVEKGMPQALTTVVGVAASGEALGKVFDCLQNQDVARGLIFALMLQALRTIIQ